MTKSTFLWILFILAIAVDEKFWNAWFAVFFFMSDDKE